MNNVKLVTRGDDAGSCDSANRAIVEACDAGLLRNVSVMVPGPVFAEVARLFAGRDDVCLGLHVTLNAEWDGPQNKWGPVLGAAQVPSLVDENGFFWPTPRETHDRGGRVEEMLAEIEAQLDRARAAGLKIEYIDEHMGVSHPWPELRQGIAALARREGLVDAHGLQGLPKAGEDGDDRTANWIRRLQAAPIPGTYTLVTHPGHDADDMRAMLHAGLEPGDVARDRDADRRAWCDPRLAEAIRALNVSIVRYIDVLPRAGNEE